MSWLDFWNSDTPIYVSERHKSVHYAGIADDIIGLLPGKTARVVDFGCGEALSADRVAACCGRLYLCDGAAQVRQRLADRFSHLPNVTVVAPEDLKAVADRPVDLIVVNSVVQYLSAADLEQLLALWRHNLAPGGRLIVADVIPPDVGPLTDAMALLRLGAANGFLLPAAIGLVKTFFSDYRRLRNELGLAFFTEAAFLERLREAGFDAQRLSRNLGHNQARMAFRATRTD
jgi:SAM-dependent methyltransferase